MLNAISGEEASAPAGTQALRQQQERAREAMYAALNSISAVADSARYTHPTFVQARNVYEATVSELAQLLGPEAHCAIVDCDKWSLFSDMYKDDSGSRPHGHFTVAQVDWWLEHWKLHGLQSEQYNECCEDAE